MDMDLDTLALACITTLRTAAARAIAAPDGVYWKLETIRGISKSLQPFNFVLKRSPSKAAEAYREATMAVGQLLLQLEQAQYVPVKCEVQQRTRQHGMVFGGMAVKTLSR